MKFLISDELTSIRDFLCYFLESKFVGCCCFETDNLQNTIDILRKEIIDFLIIDLYNNKDTNLEYIHIFHEIQPNS